MNKNFEMKILVTIHSKMKRSLFCSYSYTRLTFKILWTNCLCGFLSVFLFGFKQKYLLTVAHCSSIHADEMKMILNNHETKLQFTEHSTLLLLYRNEDGSIRTYLERSIARILNQPHTFRRITRKTVFRSFVFSLVPFKYFWWTAAANNF